MKVFNAGSDLCIVILPACKQEQKLLQTVSVNVALINGIARNSLNIILNGLIAQVVNITQAAVLKLRKAENIVPEAFN